MKKLFVIPLIVIPLFILREILLLVLLSIAAIAFSYFCKKYKLKRFGMELITFTTVIGGFLFGAIPGMITGIVLAMIHNIMMRRINFYWMAIIPAFGITGALAGTFTNVNIVVLGLCLTMIPHIAYIMYRTFTKRFPLTYMPYLFLNLAFNFFLFKNFSGFFI